MTKPLHAGFAVHAGLTAVELAALGATAGAEALGGDTGLLHALTLQKGAGSLGFGPLTFLALQTSPPSIKKYPTCYAGHRVIDGVIDAYGEGVRASQVANVKAYVSPVAARVLSQHVPTNVLEAKFSLEFAVACALVHGAVGLLEVTEATLHDDQVQALMQVVDVIVREPQSAAETGLAASDRVVITLLDGQRSDSGEISFARGSAAQPLRAGELEAKLKSCIGLRADMTPATIMGRVASALGMAQACAVVASSRH